MGQILLEQKRVVYDDWGKGLPIVLIHPPGMGRKVFLSQEPLADDFRLLIPDLSGHGDSATQKNEITIQEYADEIKAMLDEENISQAIICGYSAGGTVAQQFALSYPGQTTAVILSGGFPKVNTRMLRVHFQLGIKLVEVSCKSLAQLLAKSHTSDKQIQSKLYSHMLKTKPSIWHNFYQKALMFDCSDLLHLIDTPLFTIYGTKSPWILKHDKLYERCPHLYKTIIKGVSHQIPSKQWYTFNQLLRRFIKEYM
ncbi:MAG: alpha/beta hydrolase [Bacillaceae bacterium]|nr:alpha/beta hydrolase [Bacillaceae bacterium]